MFRFTTPNKKVSVLIALILSTFTLQGPAEAATPKAGSQCQKIGQTVKSGSSQLECRWIANGKKIYFALSKQTRDLPPVQSPEPLTACRLPEQITNKIDNWTAPLSIAYPAKKSTLNPLGSNAYLFFPIDFEIRYFYYMKYPSKIHYHL